MLDFVATAVGEFIVYLLSLLIGKTLNIKEKDAYRIGELVLLSILAGAMIIITITYS